MASNSNLSDDLKKMDSKKEKDWNDLPKEIKLECIQRMDFPTRWALHYTSHAEKELVESIKWDGELMKMDNLNERFVTCSSSSKFRIEFEHENHAALESVLRIGRFKSLYISCSKPSFKTLLAMCSKTPFYIQELKLFAARRDDLEILRHCGQLEVLQIESRDKGITHRELLNDCEIIAKTKYVYLDNFGCMQLEELIQLIEKWIADDKEMGAKFENLCLEFLSQQQQVDIREGLKSAFSDRFQVSKLGEEEVYIAFKENRYIGVRVSKYSAFTSLR